MGHVDHVALSSKLRGDIFRQSPRRTGDQDQRNGSVLRVGARVHLVQSASGSLFRLVALCGAARSGRHDGQSATGHAEQYGRPIGVAARREPADVLRGAIVASHSQGFNTLDREIRRRSLLGWLDVSSHLNFPTKHMTCQALTLLRRIGYEMMTMA
jgi:hypothetical protein